MTRVFADTFYFLALLNQRDEAHAKALAYSSLIDKLVTTEWVLTEFADGLASSRHRKMFVQTRMELLADADAQIVAFDGQLYEEGIRLFEARNDKEWSLTDCISFVVMKRESITDVDRRSSRPCLTTIVPYRAMQNASLVVRIPLPNAFCWDDAKSPVFSAFSSHCIEKCLRRRWVCECGGDSI